MTDRGKSAAGRVQQMLTGGTHAKGSDRGRGSRPSTMGFCPKCDGWYLRHRHDHELYDEPQETVDESGAPDDVPSLEAFVR